ncbi:hypothetical protein ACFCV9_37610 [Streptomyces sp. NPDC056367]|uniref:hypothetical protein n=1 Tax=Streptomyces sp. NPDC056367 TaxID=3345797 RepID=UPI0035D555C4
MQRGYYGPKDPMRAPLFPLLCRNERNRTVLPVFEDAPAGLAAGRAAGMRAVALATAHTAAELGADVVVRDPSAVSVQVGDGIPAIGTNGWDRPVVSGMRPKSVRYSDAFDR